VTVECIRYRIDGDRRDAFVAAYREATTALDDIEEMQHYAVVEGLDSDPSASSSRAT
jgi:hypothetical protein